MAEFVSAKQMSMLYRKFQKYLNKELKPFQITSSEYSYLLLLYENQHELSQDDLVKLSNIDRAAVTRAIDSLKKKGLIVKLASQNNSRHNTIRLTAKALEIENDFLEVIMNWNNLLHSGIDEKRLIITIQSLNTMLKNVEEI